MNLVPAWLQIAMALCTIATCLGSAAAFLFVIWPAIRIQTRFIRAQESKAVDDLKGGKKKPEAVKGFLRGQVMKQTGGKANPALVGELLEARLAEVLA
jgi:hypothetical protein